jgi:hypothetical protein
MAVADVYDLRSFVTSGDLTTKQYHAVALVTGAAKTVALASGSGAPMIGIVQNKPDHGQAASVAVEVESKWVCDGSGAAIAAGDPLEPDGSGRGVQSSGGARAGAIALEPCTAADLVINVQLTPGGTGA